MSAQPAGGLCPRCKQRNAYSKFTCDRCGVRLPWADVGAASFDEPCPACGTPNVYLRSTCSSCQARLPWAEAAAPRRAASGQAEAEQKSMALVVVAICVAFVLTMGILLFSLPFHP